MILAIWVKEKKPCIHCAAMDTRLKITPTRRVKSISKLFLYRGFDSVLFVLIQIILILWSIRDSAIKNLSVNSYQYPRIALTMEDVFQPTISSAAFFTTWDVF